jgi:hypothetical protein
MVSASFHGITSRIASGCNGRAPAIAFSRSRASASSRAFASAPASTGVRKWHPMLALHYLYVRLTLFGSQVGLFSAQRIFLVGSGSRQMKVTFQEQDRTAHMRPEGEEVGQAVLAAKHVRDHEDDRGEAPDLWPG